MSPKRNAATGGPLQRLVTEFADYRRRQRDYRHLQELPDALLEDIGLSRGQINAAKWRPFV